MSLLNYDFLSCIIGHTVTPFVIYSYEKYKESKQYFSAKSLSNDLNGVDIYNESLRLHSNNNCHPSVSITNSDESIDSFDESFYDEMPRHLNMNQKNDVAQTRFISEVNMQEVRSLLHGTWNPEDIEIMWNQINGNEREVNMVFNDVHIVTEEHLIQSTTKMDVVILTNHIRDFVKYNVDSHESELSKSKFEYNNKYVVLFGGCSLSGNENLESHSNLNSLIQGDLNFEFSNRTYYSEAQLYKSKWEILEVLNPPEPRAFHGACVLYGDLETPFLSVCGGIGHNKELLDCELYLLSLSSRNLSWKLFKTSGPLPTKRYGHTLSHVGSHLVMFGGTDGTNLFNDLWSLNINDGTYVVPGKVSANCWKKVFINGLCPSPRAFHSCCKVGISSISPVIVYGGLTNQESVRSRLYALHFVGDGRMIWSILPVYVKSPSENRSFHTMTFLDNIIVITGGDDFRNYQNNMRSLSYSMEHKSFIYIEDVVPLTGHCSWAAFGLIYHWGGLTTQGGKLAFDNSISISNPLAYTDDSKIDEMYFKYIQFASINSAYSETVNVDYDKKPDDSDVKEGKQMNIDNHYNEGLSNIVDKFLSESQSKSEVEYVTIEDKTLTSINNMEVQSLIENQNQVMEENPQETTIINKVEYNETYRPRPRRSAALKCLSTIELDNLKHREQERAQSKENNSV